MGLVHGAYDAKAEGRSLLRQPLARKTASPARRAWRKVEMRTSLLPAHGKRTLRRAGLRARSRVRYEGAAWLVVVAEAPQP